MPTRQPPRAFLAGGQVGQVGAVALAGVDDEHARFRAAASTRSVGGNRGEQERVVTERLAEAAGIDEVALHVDDEQRGRRRIEIELVGFRRNDFRAHDVLSLRVRTAAAVTGEPAPVARCAGRR